MALQRVRKCARLDRHLWRGTRRTGGSWAWGICLEVVGTGEAPACCNYTHLLFLTFSGAPSTERGFFSDFVNEWSMNAESLCGQKWRENRSGLLVNCSDGRLFSEGCIACWSVLDLWLYDFTDKTIELSVIQGHLRVGNEFQKSQSISHSIFAVFKRSAYKNTALW